MRTILLITIGALLLGLLISEPTIPTAYFLEYRETGVYVVDDLGNDYAKVASIEMLEDPESVEEVLETQVGWDSGLAASEAFFYILED